MSETNEQDDRSGRRAAEGVRIIGPEEAQAALDAGAAAGRRPDDELRFGDVPPAPSGPRPPHRFPLPDSVDPAEAVPRPPVVPPPGVDPTAHSRSRPTPDARSAGADADAEVPTAAPTLPPPDVTGAAVDPAPDVHPVDHGDPRPAEPTADGTGMPITVDAVDATAAATAMAPPAQPGAGDTADDAVDDTLTLTPGPAPSTDDAPYEPAHRRGPSRRWLGRSSTPDPDPARSTAARLTDARPTDARRTDAGATEAVASVGVASDVGSPGSVPPSPGPEALPGGWASSDRAAGTWSSTPQWPEPADDRAAPDPAPPDLAPPDEGITVSGGYETELPHWTDPPTGEVPRILADRSGDEDLAAWEALGSRSTTWRDDNTGWGELDGLDNLADDHLRVGALDQTRTEHSDLYSFDEEFDRLEEERSGQQRAVPVDDVGPDEEWTDAPEPARVTRVTTRQVRPVRTSGRPRSGRRPRPDGAGVSSAPSASELTSRVGVGLGLVVLLVIAYAVGPVALLVLAAAVITAAAAEVYDMLRPSGFRPATLLGLVATVGVVFAAYWRGPAAIPLTVVLVFVASMLWYLLRVVDARPLANVAVTLSAFVWVGVLGSYAALLLRAHHGRGLFLGAVLPAVAADIVAYFTGRRVGHRLLAPSVSPGKTWEGALGGGVAAVVVAVVVGHVVSPWGGVTHGLVLGLVVAVFAPIGDLFESMVKRDLSVKDSGSMLSGHGGVLDRFDAVLLMLPAAYYLASLWGYVK